MSETKTTCVHCGRPLADGLCRPEKLGFFCWAKGLQVSPENIIGPSDSTPEHARRVKAKHDGAINKAAASEAEAAAKFRAADAVWLSAVNEERSLNDDGGKTVFNLRTGDVFTTTPEAQAHIDALRLTIAQRFEEREVAGDSLKRARIALATVQHARTVAGIRAELYPGMIARVRAAVGV